MKLEKTEIHVGMRNLKTALAILVCLLIYQVIPGSASYACITALIVMQSTLEESLEQARNRVVGIVIGGAAGAVFSSAIGLIGFPILRILAISVGVTLLILLCNLLGKRGAIVMGCVTYLVIMLPDTPQNPWLYSLLCVIDNTVGITVAVLVNFAIRRPKKQLPEPESKLEAETESEQLQPEPKPEPDLKSQLKPEPTSENDEPLEAGEPNVENTGTTARS